MLEYALASSPLDGRSAANPLAGRITLGNNTYLTLTYNRAKSATDMAYTVQVSSDRGATWHGGSRVATVNTVNGIDTVTVQTRVVSALNRRQLIRLTISTQVNGTTLSVSTAGVQ